MKQTNPMRWIEAAEARSVWMIAAENRAGTAITAALPNPRPVPSVLARLREQLCLDTATRRLSRFYRSAA